MPRRRSTDRRLTRRAADFASLAADATVRPRPPSPDQCHDTAMTDSTAEGSTRHLSALQLLFIVLPALLVAGVILFYSPSVLYSCRDSGALDPAPVFTIFNPLRDRAPEFQAGRVLQALRAGDCASALHSVLPTDRLDQACQIEIHRPLTAWSLADRQDKGLTTTLHFKLYRDGFLRPGLYNNAWLTMKHQGNGIWTLVHFDALY